MEAQRGLQADLPKENKALFDKIAKDLPILADMSRADLLLYARLPREEAVILWAHARPHSSTPLYDQLALGERVPIASVPALGGRIHVRRVHTLLVRGATVARQVFPVYDADHAHVIGYMVRDAYWLAYERHRRRSRVFQRALDEFTRSVLRGDLEGAESLSPFGEHDGIVYVGPDRCIQYMSGIAAGLYRNLGYRDSPI
ncbi:MAG: histidine kinase N-terminal domain-containing protein, partial [Chloroflexi bacterium]|nr:histidine kinase N-terminal domain-containing protein [Chloroflexota bacterium]